MSYSTITAAKILYSGPPPNEIGAEFPEATPAPGPTMNDPCPTIPGCSYLRDHPPSISKCGPSRHYSNFTLSPGCYNNLSLSGTDTLNPGLYVINGQFHVNGANVSGSGVTIYMTANVQDTNFSSARLTLSAPTNGNYNGVLFYRPPWQSATINFSTCTCNFTGILYFPTTPVNYADTGGNYQRAFPLRAAVTHLWSTQSQTESRAWSLPAKYDFAVAFSVLPTLPHVGLAYPLAPSESLQIESNAGQSLAGLALTNGQTF
jgi:hypothetical protein